MTETAEATKHTFEFPRFVPPRLHLTRFLINAQQLLDAKEGEAPAGVLEEATMHVDSMLKSFEKRSLARELSLLTADKPELRDKSRKLLGDLIDVGVTYHKKGKSLRARNRLNRKAEKARMIFSLN